MNVSKMLVAAVAFSALCALPLHARAQFLGAQPANDLHNLSLLKPPAGSKVAIVVFEDLGCPACKNAHPIESDVAAKAHVPLLRYDFPIEHHIWTFQGAVCARYIQKKISPALANAYRSDVFAAQRLIDSQDDLERFTQLWLQRHGQQMPFVMDPDGSLAKAVRADYDLGMAIHVQYTPTVVVVTNDNYQVVCGATPVAGANDPEKLGPVVEAALTRARTLPPSTHTRAHPQPTATAEPQ